MTSGGEMLLGLKCPPGAKTEVGRLNLVINSSRGSKLFSELDADPTIAAREVLVGEEGAPETECLMLLVGGTVSI